MLVLQRQVEESIEIGPDIKVTVVKIRGGYVKLGIDAPDELKIVRSELRENLEYLERLKDVA